MTSDLKYELYQFTYRIIIEAGDIIKKELLEKLEIDTKSNEHDFVTNIDKEVEKFIITKIKMKYPNHRIISEEGFGTNDVNDYMGYIWGIDPIDGTSNLVYKKEDFAISIGIYLDGIGIIGFVYDVQKNKIYSVMRDEGIYINERKVDKRPKRFLKDSSFYCRYNYIYENKYNVREIINNSRHLGYMSCASLGFVDLALGNIDVMVGKGKMKFWDIAAGKIFTDEAGVVFHNIVNNEPYVLLDDVDIIACDQQLYEEIKQRFF